MSTLTATIDIRDDAPSVIAALLRQFPKGSRVKLAMSQDDSAAPLHGLDEYRLKVQTARQAAPACSWKTTDAAMKALREGEED
ncbi:MAG: hypothetical protein ACKVY0_01040 [Prosthecobacter sp.]|uniref:hypothetical protein n=1 Tax=Prosthecobacter sp. TaxID=1965333 RepID=UPI0038FF24E1